MQVVLIKYNAGNVQSVLFALERIGIKATVTDNVAQLLAADKVIIPGVGEASTAMQYLRERKLDEVIKNLKQPVLGICLGMQLLCNYSEENDTTCLGIFDTSVRHFSFADGEANTKLKVPHIGWNKVEDTSLPIFSGINIAPYCYFVHSYYAELCEQTTGATEHGIRFSAALEKDNFYGVQFHPEKSAAVGEQILKNFLNL
ncbi:MAG: imidazole glycerol phosphate synthase subunit HisH [Chitinophagaceae bacterium]